MPKARIKLASIDINKVNEVCSYIKDISDKTGVEMRGPIPLPTKKEVYTVLRSPVIDKKSREQFALSIHKRLLEILEPTSKTVDALRKLNLPAGVDVEIR